MLENLTYVKEISQISTNYIIAGTFLFLSCVCSIVSFFSPFWSKYESVHNLNDHFLNIGLWQVCLNRYKHWQDSSKFKKIYTGCYWIWTSDFGDLREWLNPHLPDVSFLSLHKNVSEKRIFSCLNQLELIQLYSQNQNNNWVFISKRYAWFNFVQLSVALSLILTLGLLFTITLSLFSNLRVNLIFQLSIATISTFTAILSVTSLIIYGVSSTSKEWMPNPDDIVLGLSYWFQIFATCFCLISASCFFTEVKSIMQQMEKLKEIRDQLNKSDNDSLIESVVSIEND